MNEKLIELLEKTGYEAYIQGSFSSEREYPKSFFTIWNFDSTYIEFYSNVPNGIARYYWIYFYSLSPLLPDIAIGKAIEILKENNWIINSPSIDINTNVKQYSGKQITAIFIEEELEK